MAIKVVVTGTHGQLAQAIREQAQGHEDMVLVSVGRPEFDLENPDTIARTVNTLRPDVVVSAASFTDVEGAEDDPERAHRVNVEGIEALARAAREVSARMVHLSTDYVFDGRKGAPYVETDPPDPLSVYGRSKAEGEGAVRCELPDHVILRTAWLYSPFGKNFVKTMLSLAQTRDTLRVIDDQTGNPTSALDLADAILTILKRWRSDSRAGLGETFHCAGKGSTTWCRFAEQIFAHSRSLNGPVAKVIPIATGDWPAKARRPQNAALACNKFENTFEWSPPRWETSSAPVVSRLVRGAG